MTEIVADSKKRAAFRLFDEGKTPLDPEVRALGLKSTTRANYYYLWREGKTQRESQSAINETRRPTVTYPPDDETEDLPDEANMEDRKDSGEPKEITGESKEKITKADKESVSTVSEATVPQDEEGKTKGPEIKIATTVADDGIKCTVFLSLQTLSLYKIAATTESQSDGGDKLTLGDFIDTCVEDYFRGRRKKLGLIKLEG